MSRPPAAPRPARAGLDPSRALALGLALLLGEALAPPAPFAGPAPLRLGPAPASALELRGSTYFTSPPWKVEWLTYSSNIGETGAEHYVTIALSPQAGASLARLSLEQIRGADSDFLSQIARVRAFVGRPRREQAPVPVQAGFDPAQGRFMVEFPEPVPPGTTVTVALRPWRNPLVADTYLFQAVVWPAGPDPVATPVGVATLRIYSPVEWR